MVETLDHIFGRWTCFWLWCKKTSLMLHVACCMLKQAFASRFHRRTQLVVKKRRAALICLRRLSSIGARTSWHMEHGTWSTTSRCNPCSPPCTRRLLRHHHHHYHHQVKSHFVLSSRPQAAVLSPGWGIDLSLQLKEAAPYATTTPLLSLSNL